MEMTLLGRTRYLVQIFVPRHQLEMVEIRDVAID